MRRSFARSPKLPLDCPGYFEECPIWGADVAILNDGAIAWVLQGFGQRVTLKRRGKAPRALSPRKLQSDAAPLEAPSIASLGVDDGRMLWWTTSTNQIETRDLLPPRMAPDGCPVRSRFRLRFRTAAIRSYEGVFFPGIFAGYAGYATLICDVTKGTEFQAPGGRGWLAAVDGSKALLLDFYPGEGELGCDVSYARVVDLGTQRASATAKTPSDFYKQVGKVWRGPAEADFYPDDCDPQLHSPTEFATTASGRPAWIVPGASEEGVEYDMLFTIKRRKIVPLAYAQEISSLTADGERFTWSESGVTHTE